MHISLYYCRYAFIRYNSVEESIAAYKQAHELMWDTKSIIVKFRRLRGNACLPGEPKPNVKKIKEKPNNATQVTEENANNIEPKSNADNIKERKNNIDQASQEDKINHANKSPTKQEADKLEEPVEDNSNLTESKSASAAQKENTNSLSSPISITSAKTAEEQQHQQPWVINVKSHYVHCICRILNHFILFLVKMQSHFGE